MPVDRADHSGMGIANRLEIGSRSPVNRAIIIGTVLANGPADTGSIRYGPAEVPVDTAIVPVPDGTKVAMRYRRSEGYRYRDGCTAGWVTGTGTGGLYRADYRYRCLYRESGIVRGVPRRCGAESGVLTSHKFFGSIFPGDKEGLTIQVPMCQLSRHTPDGSRLLQRNRPLRRRMARRADDGRRDPPGRHRYAPDPGGTTR